MEMFSRLLLRAFCLQSLLTGMFSPDVCKRLTTDMTDNSKSGVVVVVVAAAAAAAAAAGSR